MDIRFWVRLGYAVLSRRFPIGKNFGTNCTGLKKKRHVVLSKSLEKTACPWGKYHVCHFQLLCLWGLMNQTFPGALVKKKRNSIIDDVA